jgi:hypothetical protein
VGTDLFVSGKFVYSQWVGDNVLSRAAAIAAASDSVPNFALTRIDPKSGRVLWRREFRGEPDTINVRGTWLMVQFPKRIEVMKFFSL